MKKLIWQLGQAIALCALLLSLPTKAWAQDDKLSQAELDQMLAPVALYPDTVLTHVLIAATYPLEIVQASRWSKNNADLDGDDAVRAVENKDWDPSVKALVAFPQLLQRLSDDLEWTEQLGEAFLQDEAEVMASIQGLRQRAYANGNLNDNKHVVVERERDVIVIEPARKEVIYVPVYDTRVVYGDWWWPRHPPVYWHTSGVYFRSSPFYWGVSVNVRPWFYFGIFDWHQRHVIVNHHYYYTPPRYYPKRHTHYVDARRWHHNTEHRRGVHYRHERLNREYNAGYGYRQPTREMTSDVIRHTRVEHDNRKHDNKQYQRKTAEQVKLPEHNWRDKAQSPRQHNAALRQERTVSTTQQRVRSTDYNINDKAERKQQLTHKEETRRPERERNLQYEQRKQEPHNVQTARDQRKVDAQQRTMPVQRERQSEQRSNITERRDAQPSQRQPFSGTREHSARQIE